MAGITKSWNIRRAFSAEHNCFRQRNTTRFSSCLHGRTAAGHSPYGMLVIDNCLTCKLRNSNFSCALSNLSLEGLDQIKHAAAYPEGALIFFEGQTPRGV